MSPAALLRELRRRGVHVWVEDGRLRYGAPSGTLTPQLRAALAAHRDALVRLLEAEPWDEGAAERLLQQTIGRCAEAYERAGPPWPPLPDLEPFDRAINEAWERQDMPALRRALAAYEPAVRGAVQRRGVA